MNIWKEDKTAKAIHNFNAHIYLLCLQLVVIQMTPLEFTVWALTPDWMIWWKITPNNNIFLKSLPSPCCFYVCLLLISVLWKYFPIKFHQSSLLEWGLWGKLCTTMQKCIRPIHKIHRTSKLCTIWTQDGISNVLRMFLFHIVFSFNSFFAVIKTVISSLTLSVFANKNAY